MGKRLYCSLLAAFMICAASFSARAQDDQTFRNFQFSCTRVSQAWTKYNDNLREMFEKKGVSYPPKDIYIRSFKSQNEMEVWARNEPETEYKLIKQYRICALSGILGPKRYEGDRQVPEGFLFYRGF